MADSKPTAYKKIFQKWKNLRESGLDLGPSQSEVTSAGYGGWYRIYQKGRIYSHHSVGTYEVHGNILKSYLKRNAYDRNPNIGRRELGFPKTDEIRTSDKRFPMSQFEWGQIIAVSGARGGVSISGEIYKHWLKWPGANRMSGMGYPINGNVKVAGGEVVFFERGLMYYKRSKSHTPVSVPITPPMLGNPAIVEPTQEDLPIRIPVYEQNLDLMGGLGVLEQIIRNRFYLQEVGTYRRVPLTINTSKSGITAINPDVVFSKSQHVTNKPLNKKQLIPDLNLPPGFPPILPGEPGDPPKKLELYFSLVPGNRLKNRTLYDLVFKMDNGYFYKFSPHSLYARDSWNDFALIHATDIHVSRRIDGFRKRLKRAKEKYDRNDLDQGIEQLNNWNDGFRDLIRYANFLHEKGVLDGILATGDLVDYQFENGENKQGGGNFEFFSKLILGKLKYPDSDKKQEELKVPIFTSLGNHDYRPKAYKLFCGVAAGGIGPTLHTLSQYRNFNITEREARAIQDGRPPKPPVWPQTFEIKYGKPQISLNAAWEMITTDNPDYYFRYINSSLSYLVRLGKHRLVMLDSGPDTGLPKDKWDGIVHALGTFGVNEDERTFIKGNPNCEGFGMSELNLTNIAQKETKDGGLTIIGTHAPPFNTKGTEYPHYFRETEHPTADEKEVANYLRRQVPINPVGSQQPIHDNLLLALVRKKYKDWPLSDTDYFKTGSHENLLDWGVLRGKIEQFLKLCVGKDLSGQRIRPIDLMLFGHVHTMVEMRIKWNNRKDELQYFNDFYTENPARYYSSRKYKGAYGQYERVYIRVNERGRPNGKVGKIRDRFWGDNSLLLIPPYENTLQGANNHSQWWEKHRPLFIQGAPLGPTDNNQRKDKEENEHMPDPSFEGCKLVVVRDDTITNIIQISRRELNKDTWRLPRGVSAPIGTGVSTETLPPKTVKI